MKPIGKVGVLDSGVGGLNILRHIITRLPQYDYVYIGDTLHQPYGPKSASEVRDYVQQTLAYLFDQGCELVIISCNTATAQALKFLQQQYLPKYAPRRHVLGIIVPVAQAAVMITKTNEIGVLATQGTVTSGAFAEEIQKFRPQVRVVQQAAPELVSLIEAGLHHSQEMRMILQHYLEAMRKTQIDTLILGCTHYALIADLVSQVLGSHITVVQEGPSVAERLQDYLFRHASLSHKLEQHGSHRILCTTRIDEFSLLGSEFFGSPVVAEQVTLK